MERFQIVRYGLMQVTALVYGVLASGAAVRLNKTMADQGCVMPSGYYHAIFFRDHGIFLFLGVMAWVVVVAYLASPFTRWQVDDSERLIVVSGMAVTILLAVVGTGIALGGLQPPHLHLQGISPESP